MKKTDLAYLEDILEMIEKIDLFVRAVSFQEFQSNDEKQFAVFHAMEVIGEAANKLSEDFIKQNPNFPAREAIELRNILIHGYDLIRLDTVWKTIKEHLPPLKSQVERALTAIK